MEAKIACGRVCGVHRSKTRPSLLLFLYSSSGLADGVLKLLVLVRQDAPGNRSLPCSRILRERVKEEPLPRETHGKANGHKPLIHWCRETSIRLVGSVTRDR